MELTATAFGRIFLVDERGQQRLVRRAAERLREARDERQRHDVPDLDDVEVHQDGERARRGHLNVLRRHQRFPAVVAIGKDAADEREQDDRELLQERVEAEVERRVGQREDQPVLRDNLHPGPDGRTAGADPLDAEIPVHERRQHAAQAASERGGRPGVGHDGFDGRDGRDWLSGFSGGGVWQVGSKRLSCRPLGSDGSSYIKFALDRLEEPRYSSSLGRIKGENGYGFSRSRRSRITPPTKKLDRTLTQGPRPGLEYASTGHAALDARLHGGVPRGQVSELIGPRSSGRTSLMCRMLAAATTRGELVALVDALDMFDVESAVEAGIDLNRVLWIRGFVVPNPGLCRDLNQRALVQAIRAFTLVLQAGQFGLVAFDAGEAPADTSAACRSPAVAAGIGRRDATQLPAGGIGSDGQKPGRAHAASPRAQERVVAMCACLYRPPSGEGGRTDQRDQRRDRGDRRETSVQEEKNSAISAISALDGLDDVIAIARDFSPRYESHESCGGTVTAVVIDVRGLDRLLGDARMIGEELRREAARRGVRVHVAVASTCTAALVLAITHPGLTVVEPGGELKALAPLSIGILERIGCARDHDDRREARKNRNVSVQKDSAISALSAFTRWGLRTLGEIAALPPADLSARLGRQGVLWQALARGDDIRPLVPDAAEERFESFMDLEWPIEGLDPMSFVLTRLLEPLSIRLERRDRGVAVLHVQLRLVGGDVHARSLQLPSPMRDVRTLRTLALLDLESHPPSAAIERVAIVIDPTPGRIVQHTLFASPQLTPEQLSTLLARLGAVMGQDRIGAPATVDSYRPGAFVMKAFAPGHESRVTSHKPRVTSHEPRATSPEPRATSPEPRATVLRRCRQPVPGRVAADASGRPVRVTTDRRGFVGGTVVRASGPWRTSGEWWNAQAGWDRDEWDVTLNDGGAYRVFMDRVTGGWYIDAIYD